MAVIDPSTVKLGDTVRFNTISPHDTVKWAGVVKAICDYNVARLFEDIDTYYYDVKKSSQELGAKESLKYLVLDVDENGTGVTTTRVFAVEWINLSTFEIISENTYVDLRIYDIPESKVSDIVRLIQSAGYIAEKII